MSKKMYSLLLCLCLGICTAFSQNITVKGTVTSAEEGLPVAGASVFVQGTTNGTVTDISGQYFLKNVPAGSTLIFSCIGMQDVKKTADRVVDATLSTDNELLDEVVVTAQGLTRKQKAIGYSAQTVTAKELTSVHSSDLGNSLAGKVAGAQFWGAGGSTFNEGKIILRGATSYSDAQGSEPIYVVDGAIVSRASVNMEDVESLNVLKGPSATALYGSRGANGAVVITTKKAADGKSSLEFSTTTSVETYYNHLDINKLYGGGSSAASISKTAADSSDPDAVDWTSATNLFTKLDDGSYLMDNENDENWGPRYDGTTLVRSGLSWDPTSDKYGKADTWESRLDMRDLTRAAWTNNTNIAFSKAGNGFRTRVAFNNVERQGIMYNSNATRRSFSVTSSFKPTSWLNADVSYRYRYRKTKNAATEGYSEAGNVVCEFTQWGQTNVDISELKDYQRPDGSWRTWNIVSPENLAANYHDNPFGTLYNFNIYSYNNYHLVTADVYSLLPGDVRVGVRINNNIATSRYDAKYGNGSTVFDPYFRTYHTQANDFTAQAYATWNDHFVDNRLSVETAVFAETRKYDYFYLNSYTNGGLSVPGFFNLAASASTYSTNNEETHFKTRSFFGTATVGWDDLVYLDGSIRYDIDSRLANGNNSFLYGGGSVSFMASKLIDASWLNFWKIRGSVAQVGSTLSAYNIYPTYEVGTKAHGLTTMYEPRTQVNPSIKPTISTSYEVGTEFKLFGNRLFGDINVYRKDTKNDIISANVLPQSGYAFRKLNAGMVRNQGIEVVLGGTPVRTRDIEWMLSGNITKNNNKLIRLAPDQSEYTIYWTKFYDAWYLKAIEGKPIGVITSGSRWVTNEEGKPVLQKGNAAWGDVRPTWERGVEKEVGNVQPDFTGGFSTSFRYKNITFNASLDFSIGGQIVSWTNMWGTGSGVLASTAKVNNRGVNEREPVATGGGVYMEGVDADGNPLSGYVDAYRYYHYLAYYNDDNWVYDKTYVKLREVSLRYDIPGKILKKAGIGLTNASVALVATNPWLIYSACPNLDPSEIAGVSYNYLEGGQALSTRSFGFTINLTF